MATPTTEIWVYFEVASQSKRLYLPRILSPDSLLNVGPQDQDARVRHARCVDVVRKNDRHTSLDDFSCNGIFANGIYTPSARDVRVHLGLVALLFPDRASTIRSVVERNQLRIASVQPRQPPHTFTPSLSDNVVPPRYHCPRSLCSLRHWARHCSRSFARRRRCCHRSQGIPSDDRRPRR